MPQHQSSRADQCGTNQCRFSMGPPSCPSPPCFTPLSAAHFLFLLLPGPIFNPTPPRPGWLGNPSVCLFSKWKDEVFARCRLPDCFMSQRSLIHMLHGASPIYCMCVRVCVCVHACVRACFVSWLRRFRFIGVRGIYMVICCTAGFTARQERLHTRFTSRFVPSQDAGKGNWSTCNNLNKANKDQSMSDRD